MKCYNLYGVNLLTQKNLDFFSVGRIKNGRVDVILNFCERLDIPEVKERGFFVSKESISRVYNHLKYRVTHNTIEIESKGFEELEVVEKIEFLESVFATYWILEGAIPLHASAVRYQGVTFLLVGDGGVGKSTLSRYFESIGGEKLSDDLTLLIEDGGKLQVIPFAHIEKLFQHTLYGKKNSIGMEGEKSCYFNVSSEDRSPLNRVFVLSKVEDESYFQEIEILVTHQEALLKRYLSMTKLTTKSEVAKLAQKSWNILNKNAYTTVMIRGEGVFLNERIKERIEV